VRFLVDEILNGQPKTVIGVTDQVAAQIIIDPANPANVQMGPVTVNARSLVTDRLSTADGTWLDRTSTASCIR
jgi:hypothetical protein